MFVCAHLLRVPGLIAAVMLCVGSLSAQEGSYYRVYDLRDLDAAMPPAAVSTHGLLMPPAAAPEAQPGAVAVGGAFVRALALPQAERGRSDGVMKCLAELIGFSFEKLADGIFVIGTEDEDHQTLRRLLEDLRALYVERYVVELATFVVPAENTPALGTEVQMTAPHTRQQVVAVRRTATPLKALREYTYVAGLEPVVSESSVGYASTVETVYEGLSLTLTVGAGREDAQRTSFEIKGELTDVELGKATGPEGAGADATWRVELPVVSRRSIRSDLSVEFGKPTVVSTVTGFDEETVIVVAATVQKLDK